MYTTNRMVQKENHPFIHAPEGRRYTRTRDIRSNQCLFPRRELKIGSIKKITLYREKVVPERYPISLQATASKAMTTGSR